MEYTVIERFGMYYNEYEENIWVSDIYDAQLFANQDEVQWVLDLYGGVPVPVIMTIKRK